MQIAPHFKKNVIVKRIDTQNFLAYLYCLFLQYRVLHVKIVSQFIFSELKCSMQRPVRIRKLGSYKE